MATFGALLRQYRERARVSCNELARGIGVDPSYVSRLERGEREPPRRRVIAAFAEALALEGAERAALFSRAGYWPDDLAPLRTLADRLERQARLHATLAAHLRALLPPEPSEEATARVAATRRAERAGAGEAHTWGA